MKHRSKGKEEKSKIRLLTKGQQLDTRGHRYDLQAELLDRLVVVDLLAELDDVIDDRHADRLSHEEQQTQ